MEKTIQKLLVITGFFIGAAVALTPLGTYAAPIDCRTTIKPQPTDSAISQSTTTENIDGWRNAGSTNVCVYVDPGISIDAANSDNGLGTSDVIPIFPDSISKGKFNIKVTSPRPYSISLRSAEPELANTDKSNFIPYRQLKLEVGKVGWGIVNPDATAENGQSYYIPLSYKPEVVHTNSNITGTYNGNEATSELKEFEVDIAITSSIPKGVYAADVDVIVAPTS